MCSRVGAVLAPFFAVYLVRQHLAAFVEVFMAVACFLAAGAGLFIPVETAGRSLLVRPFPQWKALHSCSDCRPMSTAIEISAERGEPTCKHPPGPLPSFLQLILWACLLCPTLLTCSAHARPMLCKSSCGAKDRITDTSPDMTYLPTCWCTFIFDAFTWRAAPTR